MKYALILCLLMGCSSSLTPIWWQDAGKDWCTTVKVKPDWYTGETATSCYRNDKVVDIQTQHTDLSMVSYMTMALGGIAAAAIPLAAIH